MNLPSDFIEWTNMGMDTDYIMPENYTTDFYDNYNKVYNANVIESYYIDKQGNRIDLLLIKK